MLANGVRVGQLSVAKIGVFKARRAYTWADDSYPITETTHLLRVASLSKMFTAACIHRLYDDKVISESTKVFAKLGITKKAASTPRCSMTPAAPSRWNIGGRPPEGGCDIPWWG